MSLIEESFSSTDQWIKIFKEADSNLSRFKEFYLKNLPYAILRSIQTTVQGNWSSWEINAKKLCRGNFSNAAEFISNVSNSDSSVRLIDLINTSKEVDFFAITKCFTECKNLEHSRQKANQDLSKGYVEDILEDTLFEIAIMMIEESIDWRLLGDGLGFNTYSCQSFSNPKEIIERWKENNNKASVCRLYFELDRMGLKEVCQYIDAISLDRDTKIIPKENFKFRIRNVTKFDLIRISELFKENNLTIDWKKIAEKSCYGLKDNPTISAFDIIWQYNHINLGNLFCELSKAGKGLSEVVTKMEEELDNGHFEPRSIGGITLSQIVFLGSTCEDYCDPRLIRMDDLKEMYLPKIRLGSLMTFTDFLVLYWQYTENRGFDLREFYYDIINILQTSKNKYGQQVCDSPGLINAFKDAYSAIKPWRSFDPILDKANKANVNKKAEIPLSDIENEVKACNVSMEVKSVAKRILEAENSACSVCWENPINAVAIPCGHLSYCLECLKKANKCYICRSEIKDRVKVYSTNF